MNDSLAGALRLEVAAASQLTANQTEILKQSLSGFPGNPKLVSYSANAGSGKTHTVTAAINALLSSGTSADRIHACTFTNASADDMRSRVIQTQSNMETLTLSDGTMPFTAPVNLNVSTLHAHAQMMLKLLDPHISGVSYYFEDQTGGASGSENESDNSSEVKALKLAFLSAIHWSPQGEQIATNCRHLIKDNPLLFPAQDILLSSDLAETASEFVTREVATNLGLGAFTNAGESGPNFCLAVATDALFRLAYERVEGFDATPVGLPEILFVDEAQDIDLTQLFYLYALVLNGVTVVMVGDPIQTLYEFRNAVSNLCFFEQHLKDLLPGIAVEVLEASLDTNFRSRREIVEAADAASDEMKALAAASVSKYASAIIDPPSVKHSRISPYISEEEHRKSAVSVARGGKTTMPVASYREAKGVDDDQIDMFDPGSALQQAQADSRPSKNGKSETTTGFDGLLSNLAGGPDKSRIEKGIYEIYRQSLKGDTAAILCHQKMKPSDFEFIRAVIKTHAETDIRAGRLDEAQHPDLMLNLRPIYTNGHNCFSTFKLLFERSGGGLAAKEFLPLSSIMIASAIEFFMTADQDISKQLDNLAKAEGLDSRDRNRWRSISYVSVPPPEKFEIFHPRIRTQDIIEAELTPFFNALSQEKKFPVAPTISVKRACASFVYQVLKTYSASIWEVRHRHDNGSRQDYGQVPCRLFHSINQKPDRDSPMMVRPWREIKWFTRRFWSAIASTHLAVPEVFWTPLVSEGVTREWIPATATLKSFHEQTNQVAGMHSNLMAEQDELRGQREEIHKQFSSLWHIKVRQITRALAKEAARLKREFPNEESGVILARLYSEHYRQAVRTTRISTWCGRDGSYSGLYKEFFKTPEEISVGKKKSTHEAQPGTIDISTIHASKGLEWTHVVYFISKPTGNQRDTSAKSTRDTNYVAMTRAQRTLLVALPEVSRDDETSTMGKTLIRAMHNVAESKALRNRNLDYSYDGPRKQRDVPKIRVHDEVSHTDLETGMTCRIKFDFLRRRPMPTMSPLSMPDYSFFFHRTMASICSALAEQRIYSKYDPVFPIAKWIEKQITNSVGQIPVSAAGELAQDFKAKLGAGAKADTLMALCLRMIPIYNRLDVERADHLLEHYCEALTAHIVAILIGSELFRAIIKSRARPTHRIFIEKPIRSVFVHEGASCITPVYGIPDVRILTPTELFVFDYKTVAVAEDETPDALFEIAVSEKTAIQVNLYQGMSASEMPAVVKSELIYVINATVPDGLPVPKEIGKLPLFTGGRGFLSKAGLEHARILCGESFDSGSYKRTQALIKKLCDDSVDVPSSSASYFNPEPIITPFDGVSVMKNDCQTCSAAIHCHKNRNELTIEADIEEEDEDEIII